MNIFSINFLSQNDIVLAAEINGKSIYSSDIQLGKTFEHSLGLLYVQSLSSMLPALALNPKENEIILDMCAAPGSKTTLISELMNNKGILFANDISIERVKTLAHNLDKTGSVNTILFNKNGHFILNDIGIKVDKILLDPPCSALGSFQDNSLMKKKTNLSRIDNLTQIQERLLAIAARLLKVGGELVYSTCTTTLEENEYLMKKFIDKYPFKLKNVFDDLNIVSQEFSIKDNSLLPGTIRIDDEDFKSEKFFIAKLIKTDEINYVYNIPVNPIAENICISDDIKVKDILDHLSQVYKINPDIWNNYLFFKSDKSLYFLNKFDIDYSKISFHRFGMKLANYDSKSDWRLSTSAVQLFENIINDRIITLEDKKQLITYYMGQKQKYDSKDDDFAIVKYKELFLGTAKLKDGILYSLYPKSRRMNFVDFNLFNY